MSTPTLPPPKAASIPPPPPPTAVQFPPPLPWPLPLGSTESHPAMDLEANRQRLKLLTEQYTPDELRKNREFEFLNWLNKIYEQNLDSKNDE